MAKNPGIFALLLILCVPFVVCNPLTVNSKTEVAEKVSTSEFSEAVAVKKEEDVENFVPEDNASIGTPVKPGSGQTQAQGKNSIIELKDSLLAPFICIFQLMKRKPSPNLESQIDLEDQISREINPEGLGNLEDLGNQINLNLESQISHDLGNQINLNQENQISQDLASQVNKKHCNNYTAALYKSNCLDAHTLREECSLCKVFFLI